MYRDIHNTLDFKRGISPAAATTDNTAFVSQICDFQGANAAEFVIMTGSLADADATFTVLFEDGDDSGLSDHAPVADNELIGASDSATPEQNASFTFAADNKVFKIGYRGAKRYGRVTVTPANNTGNAFIAGLWVLGRLSEAPSSNPPA